MTAVLLAASQLAADHVGVAGYALAYGSPATGRGRADSDLDLLFIGAHALTSQALDRLVDEVVALHGRYRLRLDTEVDHRIKLYATLRELDAALALGGFTIDPSGELHIPVLVAEPRFLNSQPFKLRLILNALTTGHVFLTGNATTYRRHRARADLTLGLLVAGLLANRDSFTIAEALAVLTRWPTGQDGKDHLGYLPGPDLYNTVRRALAELTTAQVVTAIAGTRFLQHHTRRRRLLAALAQRRDPTAAASVGQMNLDRRSPPPRGRLTR